MLHPINPAAEAELRNVLAFQRRVLEFALLPGLTVQRVPRGQNGKIIVLLSRAEVDAHFAATADWFWSHRSLHALVADLNGAVRGNAPLATQVLAAFDNDVDFDNHINDPAFAFQCCNLPVAVFTPLHALLEKFYDLLGDGFPAQITVTQDLTRENVVQQFWRGNPELNVCPACDGPPPDETNGVVHAQCDHHFPKSRHVALSVHPLNLIPVCLDCNLTFKKNRDATDLARLSELFLPYRREAFGPIVTTAQRDATGALTAQLHDGHAQDTPRLQSLDFVLTFKERWNSRLNKRVSDAVHRHIRNQRRNIAKWGGGDFDLLEDLAAQIQEYRNQRGRCLDAILTEAYLTLLQNDANERAAIN